MLVEAGCAGKRPQVIAILLAFPMTSRGFTLQTHAAHEAAASPEFRGSRRTDVLRRVESRLKGHRGLSLFTRSWVSHTPVRAIALVHGFGEHSGRYEHVGAWFAERGAVVHGFDLRGHGRSAGRRGHVDEFADYLNDLEIFLDHVLEQSHAMPVTLLGHSMGGLIVTAFAVERSPRVQSVMTSGAALALSPELSGAKIKLARLVRRLTPRLSMNAGLDANATSSDPEVVKRYIEDPLVHGTTSASHAVALIDQIERVRGAGDRVAVPMFMTHGEKDRLCPVEGSLSFYQSLSGSSEGSMGPRAELRIYRDSFHELFNDIEQELVMADMQQWMEQCEKVALDEGDRGKIDVR